MYSTQQFSDPEVFNLKIKEKCSNNGFKLKVPRYIKT